MKRIVIGTVAVLLLAGVLGYSSVSVRALWRRAAEQVEQAKSAEQMASEIEVHLGEMDEHVVRYEVKLMKAQRQSKALAEQIGKLGQARDSKLASLKKARELLSSKQDLYVIAERQWSRQEIEADVDLRLKELKGTQERLALKETNLKALDEAIAQGRKLLGEARAQRAAKVAELQTLRMRLANAQQLAEIKEITKELAGTGLTSGDTGFRKTWESLLDRVNECEIALDSPNRRPGTIHYGDPAAPRDMVAEIDEALRAAPGR
jgi:chromosome segregation ATPase